MAAEWMGHACRMELHVYVYYAVQLEPVTPNPCAWFDAAPMWACALIQGALKYADRCGVSDMHVIESACCLGVWRVECSQVAF